MTGGSGESTASLGTFSVATFNVLDFAHADGARRRVAISDGLRRLAPDIIGLQEVPVQDPDATVRELVGDGYHAAAHPGSGGGVSAILASRWPLDEVMTIDLRRPSSTRDLGWSAAVLASVDVPDVGRVLVAHHKPTWPFGSEHQRELQAVCTATAIEKRVARTSPGHTVVLGDFDSAPDSASVRFWTGRQSLGGVSVSYSDVWEGLHQNDPGYTFSPANPLVSRGEMPLSPPRRIDYILVRAGRHGPTLETVESHLLFVAPHAGVYASDHYGVAARLRPAPHPPGSWH